MIGHTIRLSHSVKSVTWVGGWMDCVTATSEFAGLLRVGTAALRQLLERDNKLFAEVEADFSQLHVLIDSLDEVAKRLREKASSSLSRFA